MRLLRALLVFIVAAEAIDLFWFDGYYGQAVWRYISQETLQIKSQMGTSGPGIRPPNLSRYWKVQ